MNRNLLLVFILSLGFACTASAAGPRAPKRPRQVAKPLVELICREWVVGQLDISQSKSDNKADKLIFERNGTFKSQSHQSTLTGIWKLDESKMIISTTLDGMSSSLSLRILSVSEKALVLATSSLGVEMILYLTPTPQRPASIILIGNLARGPITDIAAR